ncbi:MAG TPA: hypothetical protein VMK12_12710 [Anaeromyxobacteraceae bacterium]|nr:hypothetical protein [Anaeromyxobacteraceae bacterium]
MERLWVVVSAKRDGWSVRQIAQSVGLSPTRVHQLLADPGAGLVEDAMSALRELGWPAPEDPGSHDRELVADRLIDEAVPSDDLRWVAGAACHRQRPADRQPAAHR